MKIRIPIRNQIRHDAPTVHSLIQSLRDAAVNDLNGASEADLAALAADLEADGSKQTKLLKGALKWINNADESKNEELSFESLRNLQRIAAKLLDLAKA